MLAAAPTTGRERVLDVGCGAGHTTLAFAERAASVMALDLTPQMLEQAGRLVAERGLANVRFEHGNAAELRHPARGAVDVRDLPGQGMVSEDPPVTGGDRECAGAVGLDDFEAISVE